MTQNKRFPSSRQRKSKHRTKIISGLLLVLVVVLGFILFQKRLLNTNNVDKEDEISDLDEREKEKQLDIYELSEKMMKAIDERDLQTIAEHVHPEKGLIFSPYVYIIESPNVFYKNDVSSMLSSEELFIWGDYDGKGTPIELTPAAYFDEFLDVTPQLDPDDVLVDEFKARGNTVNNILDVFPDATVIEYYHDGSEEYGGIDWSSMNLVYEKDHKIGELLLVAIVRDEWTI